MWTLIILQTGPWEEFVGRVTDLGQGVQQGLLDLLVALAVMLAGWGVAALLARFARGLLRGLRFNDGVRSLLGPQVTTRHEPAGVAAWAVYWLLLSLAALLALEMLGFNLAASVGARLAEVLPRIVTSAVLFAVGSLIAMLLGGVMHRFLESAGARAARLRGQVVSVVLTAFAALLALEQLGFAAQFVMIVGVVAAASAGLALALAFGLGCRDLARDFVVEYLRSLDEEGPKRPS